MLVPIIIIVVLVVLVLFLVGIYNGLVTKRNRVDEANSQIQVQLKRSPRDRRALPPRPRPRTCSPEP
jgi:hypothetical protein